MKRSDDDHEKMLREWEQQLRDREAKLEKKDDSEG